jgi:signal transduction histidine kinase
MRGAPSITANLMRGLTLIGIIGALIFAVLDIYDVDITLERAGLESSSETFSALEQSLFPVMFMLIPMYLAIRQVVNACVARLIAAAERIDAATGEARGFRLDFEDLPAEVSGFARAVNRLLARLDTFAERREAFLGQMAHELKGPLSNLALELDGLADPAADQLKADVQKMGRLLDQLLVMAQLETRTIVPMPLDDIDLVTLAREMVTIMAPAAAYRERALAFRADDRCMVRGRREALGAALKNLVENAVRVTPAGGTVTVFVGPGRCIRVRDGGPGMSEADLVQLSRPYARRSPSDHGGAGLGLAIVCQVMAMHGGTLETNAKDRELCLRLPEEEFVPEKSSFARIDRSPSGNRQLDPLSSDGTQEDQGAIVHRGTFA